MYKLLRISGDLSKGKKRASFHLLPDYGTILPPTGATFCHCRAQNEASWENFRTVYHRHSEYAFRLQDAWFCSWKTLLSILPFTLHLFAGNPINTGGVRGEGWVKGGWRVCDTLHPYKQLVIRCLYLIDEGWSVFLKVAFYPPPPESSILSSRLWVQGYEIFSIIPHYRHWNLLVRRIGSPVKVCGCDMLKVA